MLVHSIIFKKNKWTIPSSQDWVYFHGYKPIKNVDITKNFYRWRIRDPSQFKQFVTKKIGNGIEIVFGII